MKQPQPLTSGVFQAGDQYYPQHAANSLSPSILRTCNWICWTDIPPYMYGLRVDGRGWHVDNHERFVYRRPGPPVAVPEPVLVPAEEEV